MKAKSVRSSLLGVGLLALALALPLGACKQGEGGICQIKEDCEEGLECNAGTMRCQRPGADFADAAPPADASLNDGAVPDATVFDAGRDAGLDGAPL